MRVYTNAGDRFEWCGLVAENDELGCAYVAVNGLFINPFHPERIPRKFANTLLGTEVVYEIDNAQDGNGDIVLTYAGPAIAGDGSAQPHEVSITILNAERGQGFMVNGPYLIDNRLGKTLVCVSAAITTGFILCMIAASFWR